MTNIAETLVLEHEKTVGVRTTRCDGPNCDKSYRQRDLSIRPSQGAAFTEEHPVGWWALGRMDVLSVPYLEFCSWACVTAAMLGLPEPASG